MNEIVCIDSNIFIWGVKGESSPTQKNKIAEAKEFLKWLDLQKLRILLPAPMLAEILSPVPPSEHEKITKLIGSNFLIAPFDYPAAVKCAELLHKSFTETDKLKYREENSVPKQKMKYDCMIAAICITRKVKFLYTHDVADMTKFCDQQITVKDMPKVTLPGHQERLFK